MPFEPSSDVEPHLSDDVEKWPSVCVIVPTRDRPTLLERAVTNIVEQEYPGHVECLVVFDQSTPTPIAVTPGPNRRIRTIANRRSPGLAGARNTGILDASTELVAFCDDDDEWLPGKLHPQVSLLADHPSSPLVASGIYVNYRGRDISRLPPVRQLELRDFLRDRLMEINPCTALIRREVMLESIGLVDEEIPGGYGEDYEWLLRASRVGPIVSVRQPLVRVNWHTTTTSFFAKRWQTITAALLYLLQKYPEFQDEPRGLARIEAQLAFAYASLNERKQSWHWIRRALRHYPLEQRVLAALVVNTGLLKEKTVIELGRRAGRGI